MSRRAQMKTKKLGKSLLVIFMIAVVIIAINVGIFSEKTGKATVNVAKDAATEMPFTEEQVLKAAVDVAMNGYQYKNTQEDNPWGFPSNKISYYLDCSTYVSTTIMKLGGRFNASYQFQATDWKDGAVPFTYNGQTISAQKITEAHNVPLGTAWTSAIDASLLKPGDIIAGDGHMFLYVGKAATQEEIVQQLSSKTGISIETITSTSFDASIGKLNYDNANTGRTDQYWIIEGNIGSNKSPLGNGPISGGTETNVNIPYLSNYNWGYRTDTKSLQDVIVYRITHEEVKNQGSVGLYKYIDSNGNGQWDNGEKALKGAKFKLAKKSDGTDFVQKDGADYEVTTGDNGTAIFTNIELGTATTANYYLVETYVPSGYTMKQSIIPATVKVSGYDINNIDSLIKIGNDEVKYQGKLGVYKYEDLNGNNKWDEGEPALSGAKFKLATDTAGKNFIQKDGADYEVETGKDGTALFENIDLGTLTERTLYLVETVSPEGFKKMDSVLQVTAKKDGVNIDDISTLVQLGNKRKIYDLALRKYITAVKDGATGEETEVTTRIPKITVPENFNTKDCTTLKYEHPKDPVTVHTTDIVTYNIEVFNEGPEDAYSEITKDDLPAGLEYLPDSEVNKEYRWVLVDENDNEVDDISKAKYIITDYLSKDQGEDNLIKAFDPDTMDRPDSKIVKVQFKVTEPTTSDRILINSAQIAKETDSDGKVVTDRDSTPNEWKNEDDEDIEKVRVLYFDLALRKWVTEAIVTKDGKETIYQTGHKAEDNPESIVKVDLKKSDLSKVTVKFRYKIRITNQGQIAGEAKVVRDDIPAGLKFVKEDNPDWREENGKIVTNKLATVTLQPGESTEMEIVLTWINGENNLSVKTNVSEIEEDHNNYGTHDIDSTPGNKKPKEDDIDDAPVMLAVTTGSETIKYIAFGVGLLAFIGISGIIIKKKVLNY